MGLEAVIARRRAQRNALLDIARSYVAGLDPRLRVRAAVVFGSVARGDFNQWSDLDVLVIAEDLPTGALARLDATGHRPPGLQPVAWTPDEWRAQLARKNPIAAEAVVKGVWLQGSADEIAHA